MELKKPSVKMKVEAVLFSTGHRLSLEEMCKLCRSKNEDVLAALQELKKEYEDKQSSLMLIEEGDFWKLTVRDHLIPIVKKIVTETELTKSILETLAVIAFKYPILQSDLIKIRTNKAYDHLTELEVSGYISRQKHGRTNLIKLTEKFFKYFNLTEEKLKEKFKDFESISRAISEKETEIEQIKEGQSKRAEELKKEDERIKKEIESLDEVEEEYSIPLVAYETIPQETTTQESVRNEKPITEKEKIGELEVVEIKTEKKEEEQPQIQAIEKESINEKEEIKHAVKHKEKTERKKPKRKDQGIKLTPEMESIVDKKVENMLNPENKNKEEKI